MLTVFRRGRGTADCTDCIADFTSALEACRHRGETAIAVFLDIEREFNSVPRDVILSSLSHLGMIENMFRLLVNFFS